MGELAPPFHASGIKMVFCHRCGDGESGLVGMGAARETAFERHGRDIVDHLGTPAPTSDI
jgi:hypothetical protein